jgi:vacuolar-type H+-ATPase subunit C/Vma6
MLLENYIKTYIKEHSYINKNTLNVFDFDLTLYKNNKWINKQVEEVKKSINQENTITVLCTARGIELEEETKRLLSSINLRFDKYYFNKNKESAETYKAKVFQEILNKNKQITKVNFWDDRPENIEEVRSLVNVYSITYNGYLI